MDVTFVIQGDVNTQIDINNLISIPPLGTIVSFAFGKDDNATWKDYEVIGINLLIVELDPVYVITLEEISENVEESENQEVSDLEVENY